MMILNINGEGRAVDVPANMPLLWVLRDVLGLTGTKFGCGIAQCGACTVHLDGQAVRSCVLPVSAIGAKAITTIEAVHQTPSGQKVQQAWLDVDVVQCGYCQPGQIMSAAALLSRRSNPTDADIDAAMSGNICRCGTYVRIRAAIKQAASGKAEVPQTIAPSAADASSVPHAMPATAAPPATAASSAPRARSATAAPPDTAAATAPPAVAGLA